MVAPVKMFKSDALQFILSILSVSMIGRLETEDLSSSTF